MYTTDQINSALRRMATFALENEHALDLLQLLADGSVRIGAIVDGEFSYRIGRRDDASAEPMFAVEPSSAAGAE